jgi:hypothetical protein
MSNPTPSFQEPVSVAARGHHLLTDGILQLGTKKEGFFTGRGPLKWRDAECGARDKTGRQGRKGDLKRGYDAEE